MSRCSCGEVVVDDPTVGIIDVREEDREYGYGHIRGSWHRPANRFRAGELLDRLAVDAPSVRRLIVHCAQSRARGPSAASELRANVAERKLDITVQVMSGGFDAWYDEGYPRCFCKEQHCRKVAPVAASSSSLAALPPVLLLSSTALLWQPTSEERYDFSPLDARASTRPPSLVRHLLMETLCKAARARGDTVLANGGQLRAAFVGALSGDASFVHDSFFALTKQMGERVDAKTINIFAAPHSLPPAERAWLEHAHLIIVGGCVPPAYLDAFPDYSHVPRGPMEGLRAINAARLFSSLREARMHGAVVVGLIEGAVVLGEGELRDTPHAADGTAVEALEAPVLVSCAPSACSETRCGDEHADCGDDDKGNPLRAGALVDVPGEACGGILAGYLIGVGQASSSRWADLCSSLVDAAAASPRQPSHEKQPPPDMSPSSTDASPTSTVDTCTADGETVHSVMRGSVTRALGVPCGSVGALVYPDGCVSAIGDKEARVSLFKVPPPPPSTQPSPPLPMPKDSALAAASTSTPATTTTTAAPVITPPKAAPTLLRTLLVPSSAPFNTADIRLPHEPSALWDGPHAIAEAQLEAAVEALRGCRRLVAFTGAGISAESGMPTYRVR